MEYELNVYNPETIPDYATVIIYAKRRSGKSILVQDLIYHNRKRYDDIYLFSNTIELQADDIYGFVPKSNKYNDLESDVIQTIMDKQAKEIKKYNKSKKHKVPHIAIVLDDIITSKSFLKRNNLITNLFIQGRHFHISLFVLSQSFSGNEGISPVLRRNADLIISFFLHSQMDKEALCKQYISIKDYKEGIALFQKITENPYQCIVIENHKTEARDYKDYIYTYKAALKNKKFKIGKEKGKFEVLTTDKKHENDLRIPIKSLKNTK